MANLFHPSVPDVEQRRLRSSDALRFALHVTSNWPLTVTHVDDAKATGKVKVRFSTESGFPVMELDWDHMHDEWDVNIFDAPTTLEKGRVADSKRPMYLAKALHKDTTAAHEVLQTAVWRAKDDAVERNALLTSVRKAYEKVKDARRTSMNYRDMLSSANIGILLKVFFGEMQSLDVSADHHQAFETVRAERDKRRDMKREVHNRMQEVCSRPKWLITYLKDHGYTLRGIDVSCTWEHILNAENSKRDIAQHYVTTHPQQFYRTLDDLPESIKDNVLAGLTMAKMHMQGRYSVLQYATEPHDLIPMINSTCHFELSEELGSTVLATNRMTILTINQ